MRGVLQRALRRAGIRQVLSGTADLPRARPLTEALEFFQGEAELAEDLVEEGRSDLSATMDGNRHGPAIGVVPALVASGLSTPHEAELTGHPLNSRAVALGIHDFGRVLGQRGARS